ncbi:MAG: hypothetical protein J6A29_00895 [Clostridia bacterium]|nr:hypothetical protein [Clostridia bacterium]
MDKQEEPNEIEIVTGDDSELEISTVYDHLNFDKVRENPDKNNIIIPEVKKNKRNEKKSD